MIKWLDIDHNIDIDIDVNNLILAQVQDFFIGQKKFKIDEITWYPILHWVIIASTKLNATDIINTNIDNGNEDAIIEAEGAWASSVSFEMKQIDIWTS